jgi:lipopolysaccharide transport system permease protein
LEIIGKFPLHGFVSFFLILLIQTIFSVTLGVGLGVLNVFFRDIGQFLAMILQFWFWFTTVVYSINVIPVQLQWLMVFNPMYHIWDNSIL